MQKSLVLAGVMAVVFASAMALQPSVAQNEPARDMTALTSQDESTIGRRLLMISIGSHNDTVHDILDGVLPMNDAELRGRLQSMSAMLYAFPSLYRAEPNPWTEAGEREDATKVSLAKEGVWADFEIFKQLSFDAYLKAREAAQAPDDQLVARVEELEVMCESCHEAYRKPFDFLDYDRLEDFIPKD